MKVICKERDYFRLLERRREYIVLGAMFSKRDEKLNYLVSDSGDWPDWISSKYFYVVDNEILPDWHIKTYDKNDSLDDSFGDLFFLSGFGELCKNDGYFDALVEREKWALDIYAKKYNEAVEWYEVKPFMTKKASLW